MAQVVTLSGTQVLKGRFDPGWRWSEHVRPSPAPTSAQSPHFLYVISGRMGVKMDDGTEGETGPNQVTRLEPGHDAWVIGDEPCVVVDFGASPAYARAPPAADPSAARCRGITLDPERRWLGPSREPVSG